MTPEAQRIAIAEACEAPCQACHAPIIMKGVHPIEWCRCDEPKTLNYLNDLNIMHEAIVTKFDDIDRIVYALTLRNVVLNQPDNDDQAICFNELFSVANATVAQRAEAFLRTLNLWKD